MDTNSPFYLFNTLEEIKNLFAIPVDIARDDWISAGLDLLGVFPVVGEIGDIAKTAKIADDIADTAKVADKAIDAAKVADKVTDVSKLANKTTAIARRSPIKIPQNANIKVEAKNGYSQIKYTWKSGDYQYTSRWHTRTPNAPKNQGDSWVVERRIPGVGHGKNARPAKEEVLVGNNKWVSKDEWKKAIAARKSGTASKEQKEMLDNGHWKDK